MRNATLFQKLYLYVMFYRLALVIYVKRQLLVDLLFAGIVATVVALLSPLTWGLVFLVIWAVQLIRYGWVVFSQQLLPTLGEHTQSEDRYRVSREGRESKRSDI